MLVSSEKLAEFNLHWGCHNFCTIATMVFEQFFKWVLWQHIAGFELWNDCKFLSKMVKIMSASASCLKSKLYKWESNEHDCERFWTFASTKFRKNATTQNTENWGSKFSKLLHFPVDFGAQMKFWQCQLIMLQQWSKHFWLCFPKACPNYSKCLKQMRITKAQIELISSFEFWLIFPNCLPAMLWVCLLLNKFWLCTQHFSKTKLVHKIWKQKVNQMLTCFTSIAYFSFNF